MAAIGHGRGEYTEAQVRRLLSTAYTAFVGAAAMSEGKRCVVHSGNWGCGAFGNSVTVISAVQCLAAKLAGVELVYHYMGPPNDKGWASGSERVVTTAMPGTPTDKAVSAIIGMRKKWGLSNGT
eukprot:Hpha_TRINITY_DN2070_c0_g2::TRINITY_DN2070_c0_g2_i1::g.82893::m.82893